MDGKTMGLSAASPPAGPNLATKARAVLALALSAALVTTLVPQLAQPQRAGAAELQAGMWLTVPTATHAKLAKRLDEALAAQDPKPQVKTTTNKRTKTVTTTVSCKAKKAGVQYAKSKKERAYASLAMRLYADNLYRSEKTEGRVTTTKTVHGVNNFGKDRASDYSLYVGSEGTAEIYLRYTGDLCTYKKGTFRKANFEDELYYVQTKKIKVASVKIPEGYRLKLQLKKR